MHVIRLKSLSRTMSRGWKAPLSGHRHVLRISDVIGIRWDSMDAVGKYTNRKSIQAVGWPARMQATPSMLEKVCQMASFGLSKYECDPKLRCGKE